jgi:signal peptidase I
MRKFWEYLYIEWFRQVGEALLLAFLVTTFLFTTVGVVGSSMNPSLLNGERVFVPKYETWLVRFGLTQWRRGEVAIVKPPEGIPNAYAQFPILGFPFRAFFIKRIVGVPGDEISLRDGVLYRNGQMVNEEHITRFITPFQDSFPGVCYLNGELVELTTQQSNFALDETPAYLEPTLRMLMPPSADLLERSKIGRVCEVGTLKIEPGYYFLMGDNRTFGGSEDSRTFGPVPSSAIAGRANFVWWPPVVRTESGVQFNLRGLGIPEGFR